MPGGRVSTFYRKRWWAELRRGVDGQSISKPSSWKLTDLWRAACAEANADDARRAGVAGVSELMQQAESCYRQHLATAGGPT
jgi:hypothetical protein